MVRKRKRRRDEPEYTPTPEEIQEQCEAMKAQWGPGEERYHRCWGIRLNKKGHATISRRRPKRYLLPGTEHEAT